MILKVGLTVWALISFGLMIHLWRRKGKASIVKKAFWTVVLAIPLFGWIFYGAFYTIPDQNTIHAQGGAGGWAPWLK